MDAYILTDRPSPKEANARRYRNGMIWTTDYKPGVDVAGQTFLEHQADALDYVDVRMVCVGDPTEPGKILSDRAHYINPGHPLSKKISYLANQEDDFIILPCDVVPRAEELAAFVEAWKEMPEAAFFAPAIQGGELITHGLRKQKDKKLYWFKEGKQRHHISFPQIWGVRPKYINTDPIIAAVDPLYMNREDGLGQGVLPLISYLAHKPGLLFGLLGFAFRSKMRYVFPNMAVGSLKKARKTLAHVLHEYDPSRLMIPVENWTSLGYDVDTWDEHEKLENLVRSDYW